MSAAKNKNELYSNNMSMSVFWSILFHVSVFIAASVSFPHFVEEIEPMEMAITVELADLAEISGADKTPPKPKPVYNNTESPPDLIEPKEPEIETADIPEPPKDKPKVDESIIKKPPKPKNKPRIKKPKLKETPKPKPKDEKDFTSLLKSLTPEEPEPEQVLPSQDIQEQEEISQIADFSKQMTRSEMDDLNRGVQLCWNVNAGGKDAHSLKVELWVFVNQDRTVRDVQIIDQMRYNSDTHFRAAAEAARRALLNQKCSTLNLPPEKYERWKKFKYIFDPSNML